jgi:hypothetical protein
MMPNNDNGMMNGFGLFIFFIWLLFFVFFAFEMIFVINMVITNKKNKNKPVDKDLHDDKFHKFDKNFLKKI